MKIHPVNHAKGDTNRFCGPSAISIVTGMTSGGAARLLRLISGKAAIKGTSDHHMARALRLCGIDMRRVYHKPQRPVVMKVTDPWCRQVVGTRTETRPTMTQWLKDSQKLRTPGRVFLVSAGCHWQIVSGRRFCCGKTMEIVSITDKRANRRARVEDVYELVVQDRIKIPSGAAKPKATGCPYRRDLKAIERKLGSKGRVVRDGDWKDYVIDPCPTFPKGLSVCHYDFGETYGRVKECVENPALYAEAIENGNDGHVSF